MTHRTALYNLNTTFNFNFKNLVPNIGHYNKKKHFGDCRQVTIQYSMYSLQVLNTFEI